MQKLRNYRTRCLNKNVNAGFTLIELLVSLALFTVVIVMSVGTLLVLIDANTKAQNMQEAMTNLTFALDSMTREIRTGSGYFCHDNNAWNDTLSNDSTRDCVVSTRGISFVEGGSSLTEGSGGNRIGYRLNNKKTIERKVGNGDWQPLTSDSVAIEEMRITVKNSETYFPSKTDTLQPTVTIFIKGSAGTIENVDTSFSMQTTITRRVWDL